MRGDTLHNHIANQAYLIFLAWFEFVRLEFAVRCNGVLTYFDVFGAGPAGPLAIEVETTCRHVRDNAKKAALVGIPVWFVVPERRLIARLKGQLKSHSNDFKILLLGQLEQELSYYLSRRIDRKIKSKKFKNRPQRRLRQL